MAENREHEGVTSPIPRAPPPSPECPTRNIDVTQFDFTSLMFSSSHGTSPSSSNDHSEPNSPSWNENESVNQSSFSYPSPEHLQTSISPEIPCSQSSAVKMPQLSMAHHHHRDIPRSLNGLLQNNPHTSTNQLFSGSLPINGDLQAYIDHQGRLGHTHQIPNMEIDNQQQAGERRRKISHKRQHEEPEECDNKMELESSYHVDIIKKKLCPERNHDVNISSVPSPNRRSHTFSGYETSKSSPLSSEFDCLSINSSQQKQRRKGISGHIGSLPNHHGDDMTTSIDFQKHSNDIQSHILQTIGFSTEGLASTDESMEGVETPQAGTPFDGNNVPISVSIDDNLDWNHPQHVQSHHPQDNSFSFNLHTSHQSHLTHLYPNQLNVPFRGIFNIGNNNGGFLSPPNLSDTGFESEISNYTFSKSL